MEARFTAGQVSRDGGSLLPRETDRKINLLGRLAACFSDGRSPLLVKHPLSEMLAQRIYGLALGCEDLNDHEQLRSDPLLALLSGKRELDEPLAGKSTPNRLELTGRSARYHKIAYSAEALDRLLTDLFIESHATTAPQLDFLVLPLLPTCVAVIEKAIRSKIAFSGYKGIIHVQIAAKDAIVFGAYDNFGRESVVVYGAVSPDVPGDQ